MEGFTHIVSLGYRCRTTQRLREHYGFKTAFPFDWWITPLQSAVRVLRDWDLQRLYDPAKLREAALAHAPRAEARFLLISPSGAAAEGWTPLAIDDPRAEPWTGTPQIWDAALARLGLRLQRPDNWGEADALPAA